MQISKTIKTKQNIKQLFKVSAIAAGLLLAGCDGDINLESNVDNSVGDSIINNPAPTTPTTPGDVVLPGKANTALSTTISIQMGFDVQVQILDGSISEDTTLVADNNGVPVFYAISGSLQVGSGASLANKSQAAKVALTIEPGTVLFGQSGSDYVLVHRDAQIIAEGTESQPIIFTSLQDVNGEDTAAGQWGGLVILGNAPSNKCPSDGSDCALQVEGVEEGGVFGGTDWQDNSGILKYVVVKYAGYEIAPDNELNGITFGGVGSGTIVDYIQVHANADDGVEFFGGAVNVKHLVLTGNKDDSIDWDNGYKGKLQHVFVKHAQNAGEANRAIEADNDGTTPEKEPQSNPTISNLTIIGNNFDTADKDSEGIYLREGTAATIVNTVITGPAEMGECLEFEAGSTVSNAEDGKIVMQNMVMACTNDENFKNAGEFDLPAWFTAESSNSISSSILVSDSGVPDAQSVLLGAGQDASNTLDAFFDSTAHIGAFDGTNDWRDGWAFGFGGGEVTARAEVQGCPSGTTSITPVDGVTTTCEISGRISADLTLTSNNMYALSGAVFVGGDNSDSAALTIEAGTTIFGRSGSDYLVVSRGSTIEANGSAIAPITFTSNQDVTGSDTASGQWGGIVLLGNAPSNKCPTDGSDCALQVEGVEEGGVFGGTDWEDHSGTLRYVVVKHAGYEIAPDNELNGITFAGIGSKTKVEYIQVHDNADDGVEFFGGAVNAKYVVLTGNKDDSVDWDNGFRGNMQYVLVKHGANNGEANRAIEADNDGNSPAKDPQSNPTIANMTIIGNDFDSADKDSEGIYLREGTRAQLHNFVVTGSSGMGECFEMEAGVTVDQAITGDSTITHSVFACGENFKNTADSMETSFDLAAWVLALTNNSTADAQVDVLDGIYTIDTTTAKVFADTNFFDNASHIGAVSATNDWTAGWTVGLE
ncbi:hypothetical protein [Thalassotalea sp. ND16A]|uniref:hypothetical protein n=1 Tax=Thalassotalea sp. ND16A TaxID=1535422 RepID=UPI00051D174E|nr:hypothetical protein [Thalassotalea sp. ND16A]KGJ92472.1 hypothetical protein ND16A_1650 [Thalassotalea sp. ND16A]